MGYDDRPLEERMGSALSYLSYVERRGKVFATLPGYWVGALIFATLDRV